MLFHPAAEAQRRISDIVNKLNISLNDGNPRGGIPAPKRLRINTCHDFAWSRRLWKDAADRTAVVAVVLTVAYVALGYYSLAYRDGMRGVDCWYYLATTLTTVGLGDLYPYKESTRLTAIFMLPFGLIVVGFGISYMEAMALAKLDAVIGDDDEKQEGNQDEEDAALAAALPPQQSRWEAFRGTVAGKYLVLLLKFAVVVLIGASFFIAYDKEWEKQGDMDGSFTIVDAVFFSVVVSTTVGYGHRIAPITDGAKWFMIFYMFLATIVVGQILNDLAEIYLEDVAGAAINARLMDSTVWVHKADISKDGRVDEADYVIFKLQQMQAVDEDVLERLQRRFEELDIGESGELHLGVEAPTAEQVAELQAMRRRQEEAKKSGGGSAATVMTLPQLWERHRSEMSREHRRALNRAKLNSAVRKMSIVKAFIDIAAEHADAKDGEEADEGFGDMFEVSGEQWLRETGLFEDAVARRYGEFLAANGYQVQGDFLFFDFRTFDDGRLVELGMAPEHILDFHEAVRALKAEERKKHEKIDTESGEVVKPTKISECHDFAWSRRLWKVQSDRLGVLVLALSVSYMAIGYYVLAHRDGKEALDGVYFLSATLSTVGYGDLAPVKQGTRGASVVLIPFGLFIIGFALSWSRARAKAAAPKVSFETKMRAVDDAGGDGDGVLTASELLRATTGSAFIDDGSGGGGGGGLQDGLTKMVELVESTLFFKSLVLVLQLAATATIGAVFFKLYRPEARELELSWIEAYYFAIVTSTSIGYGDITPASNGGKIFLAFYMLFSTVVTADVLGGAIDIYVNDYVGESIVRKIINSTTWVHKCDIDCTGSVSEAEYLIFKLQQLQKVDSGLLDRLINRFSEIDTEKNGYLLVGRDIPSAEQVKGFQQRPEFLGGSQTLMQLWMAAKPQQQQLQQQQQQQREERALRTQTQISMTASDDTMSSSSDSASTNTNTTTTSSAPADEEEALGAVLSFTSGAMSGAMAGSVAEGTTAAAQLMARRSSEMILSMGGNFTFLGASGITGDEEAATGGDESRGRAGSMLGVTI